MIASDLLNLVPMLKPFAGTDLIIFIVKILHLRYDISKVSFNKMEDLSINSSQHM